MLNVSETWLYRHRRELPHFRVGRAIRFDSALLLRHFQAKYPARTGSRPNPEGRIRMGLRRYQRGSVVKQGKRIKAWYGMWREDVRLPDGSFERRKRKVRLGSVGEIPTRTAAYEELARQMGEQPVIASMTFADLVERWKTAVLPTIKESTGKYYENMLRCHVVPRFGDYDICAISRYEIEVFLAEKAKMFCKNSLRGMRVSFGRVLSWSVDCGWLEKNPCSGIRLPLAGSRIKRTILKPEQVVAIASSLREPYATLVLFLAVTGLRIGEAVAIKWTDIDGDVLHIQRRIYEGKTGPSKTEDSNRDLPIPNLLLERMKRLGSGEWIFRSRNGSPINPGNTLKRYVRPVVQRLGISLGGWHDFRHTLATELLKQRRPTKMFRNCSGTRT
jgi:integrase